MAFHFFMALVSALRCDGTPHRRAAEDHGAVLRAARRQKERTYPELTGRFRQQLYNVASPCLDDHHLKKEELKSVGELSKVCSQSVSKMLVFGTNW